KQAQHMVRQLRVEGFQPGQIEIIAPDTDQMGDKLEPEQNNIARTAARAHLIFGGLGVVGSIVVAGLLIAYGPAFASANPGFTLMASAIIGLFVGLIAGGVVSLRPDHDRFLMKVLTAKAKNHWTVVVHAENREQKLAAWKVIQSADK
ncbi:MAG: hypothetical protein R3208_09240, partial [Ketobacteraceae bacterium]|nr:hypothetical protein [Ketobacteraceae bacterium]